MSRIDRCDHRVGLDALTALQAHAEHTLALELDLLDLGAGSERSATLGRDVLDRVTQCTAAASREGRPVHVVVEECQAHERRCPGWRQGVVAARRCEDRFQLGIGHGMIEQLTVRRLGVTKEWR